MHDRDCANETCEFGRQVNEFILADKIRSEAAIALRRRTSKSSSTRIKLCADTIAFALFPNDAAYGASDQHQQVELYIFLGTLRAAIG